MSKHSISIHGPTIKIQYDNGLSITKIADLHGVGKDVIYKRLRELKIPLRSRFERICSPTTLKRLYVVRHHSLNDIASKYKVSTCTVKKTLEKYKIQIRKSRAKENEK